MAVLVLGNGWGTRGKAPFALGWGIKGEAPLVNGFGLGLTTKGLYFLTSIIFCI